MQVKWIDSTPCNENGNLCAKGAFFNGLLALEVYQTPFTDTMGKIKYSSCLSGQARQSPNKVFASIDEAKKAAEELFLVFIQTVKSA